MPEATFYLIFTTSFVVALSGAMMPGPLLAITISESARRGFWAGPRLILGHAILELGVIAALAFGLSEFINQELLPPIIGLMGGTILIGIGLTTLRKGRQRETVMPTAQPAGTGKDNTPIVAGILGSISNPYWFIWWITLGTTYLFWSLKLGIAGVATFFSGHILADLAWYTMVSFIIVSGRKALNDRVYRGLLMVCGLALIGMGGYFLASAIGFFIN